MNMNILQINLNHCRLAHYLLTQAAIELKANIVLIAEPLFNPGNWIYSKKGTAAIWANDLEGNKRLEDGDIIEDDFVAIKINKETYISIYLSPNISNEEYDFRLEKLAEIIKEERRKGRSICIGGDFNAKSPSWGSKEQNDRGNILLDRLLEWGLIPIKPEGGHTYEKGKAKSNLDFIAVTRDLTICRETKTSIMDMETASDHKYLLTNIRFVHKELDKGAKVLTFRWRVTRTGLEECTKIINETLKDKRLETQKMFQPEEEESFLNMIPEICEKAFGKIGEGEGRKKKNNIWWNDEIKEQRNKVNRTRRKVQRYRKKGNQDMEEITNFLYKKSKKVLQKLIAKEKDRKWRELCETINKDPWGKPYKTVLRQVKPDTPPANISLEMARKVLQELFPPEEGEKTPREREDTAEVRGKEREGTNERNGEERGEEEVPKITEGEILEAARKLKPNKAAGLDGIVPEIVKKLAEARPDRFAALFNGILVRGKIPKDWKKARTILLRKPGKNPTEPSAYRPICVIDAMAKLMEYVTRDRLEKELGGESFDENQFGFVKGKSTVHAMDKVAKDARTASDKQRFGVMIALDVKNAFNSLKWDVIIDQMRKRGFSNYLTRFVQDYFKERTICYKNTEDIIWRQMKMGVPQGSVLGPFLWNLVYDDLLKKENPQMTSKYAFADDLIITVQASTKAGLRTRSERIIDDIREWMRTKGLSLAEHKTEIMMLNQKRIEEGFEIQIGEMKIKPSPHLKYLGVTFDDRKIFRKHIEDATNKAIKTMTALSSIMTNGIRTSQSVRKLYYMTLESIVMYGAPIWAEAATVQYNKKILKRTQKLGLARVVAAYRTVPSETLCVLSGITPWHLKIQERKQLLEIEIEVLNKENMANIKEVSREGINLGAVHPILEGLAIEAEENEEEEEERIRKEVKKWIRKKMKEVTDQIWQNEWNHDLVGRWTQRLIPNIANWRKRKYGQLDFYTTQILTGHGVFNCFRKRIGKAETDKCWYHQDKEDTVEHTVIECEEWEEERREMIEELKVRRENLTVEKIIEESIKKGEKWKAFAKFCRSVLKKKEEEERRRERMQGENPAMRGTQGDIDPGDPDRMSDL